MVAEQTTERFQVVPAAYVIFRRELDGRAQVLLQLRRGTGYMDGYWATAAAGHVEADEPVFAAACRESAEELGVTIEPADLVALCGMHRTAGNHDPIDERVDFFFQVERWRGDPRLVEPDKAAELEWFDLHGLPDPVVPHELFVLNRLREGGIAAVVTYGF
jgi:8-oxo-dGTP pyrophosphatase MutT (NUDIX family)